MNDAPSFSSLIDAATDWISHDPDPDTVAEVRAILDRRNTEPERTIYDELYSHFFPKLSFGTAGLRGTIAAGPACMNVATVMRASAGVAAWLVQRMSTPRIVLGCDARYKSADFYEAAAEVFSAAGCEVICLPKQRPTPFTAYSVRALNADAGVMITASHNPPQDNGYKLYLGGRAVDHDWQRGVQLVSPADAEIAALIDAAPPADAIARNRATIQDADPALYDAYVERVASLRSATRDDDPKIVFTAMHGVGASTLRKVLEKAGFRKVVSVEKQEEPDPAFPTVAFPNPEEPGALDLAFDTARATDADVILALDPDADRCSVAVPTQEGWRQLSGDEVGMMLGEDAAVCLEGSDVVIASSIVSSRMVQKIAAHHGLAYRPTLTGFKWIGRTEKLGFGYEEALGYCTDPEAVRDKDGISACLRMADMCSRVMGHGQTMEDYLTSIGEAYGLCVTAPLTFRLPDPADIAAALERLHSAQPEALAGSAVTHFVDLAEGYEYSTGTGTTAASGKLPPTTGYLLLTEKDDRVIIRPSGTEPKLKCYLEVSAPTRSAGLERLDTLALSVKKALGL